MDEKYGSLQGKRLLITGGTGTFGNAVLRHSLMLGLGEIIVFSRDEKKQDEMRHLYASPKIKWVIGDVRDYGALRDALTEVDFVFHAAALKQVPSCEFYPMEAVRTNVLGTENVCNAAVVNGVKRVILLSTDKAAYPVNAMGMSKALAEAVQRIFDRRVGTTIIGTRHGEKLYETLLTREEMTHATDMGDYFRVPADTRDLNYQSFYTEGERQLSGAEDYHSHNATRLEVEPLTKLLGTLEEVREALRARAA